MKIALSILMVAPLLTVASHVHASSQRNFRDLITGFGTRQIALAAPGLPNAIPVVVQEVGKDFFCAKWVSTDSEKWDAEGTVRCYPLQDVRWITLPSPDAAKQTPIIDVGSR